MQPGDIKLETQKKAMTASSLHNLGLSTGETPLNASRSQSKPLKIFFNYPTPDLARDALEFFRCFVIIFRGQKITFSATPFVTLESEKGETGKHTSGCSILLTEERELAISTSTSTIPTANHVLPDSCSRFPRPSVLHLAKDIADVSSQSAAAHAPSIGRSSHLALSASSRSGQSARSRKSSHISLAESFCAPDTSNRYYIAVSNIPMSMTAVDILNLCIGIGVSPLEESPVVLEATLETNSHHVYTVQRSMSLSFPDLATAMLCRDFLDKYVTDQAMNTTLVAKLVDKNSSATAHKMGVLVRNLPHVVQQDTFLRAMLSFGGILSCRFVRGTRKNNGFGAVVYETSEAAELAKQQGLIQIKELTLQAIKARKLAKRQQQEQEQEHVPNLKVSFNNVPVTETSVNFSAASRSNNVVSPVLIAPVSNSDDDSINDVIRAIVEANNRLILSRKDASRERDLLSTHANAQMEKLDLMYTAMHNHHLADHFFRNYEALLHQSRDDERLLTFLKNNAALHQSLASSAHTCLEFNSLRRNLQVEGDTMINSVQGSTLRSTECSGTFEIDAKDLELEITTDTTITDT